MVGTSVCIDLAFSKSSDKVLTRLSKKDFYIRKEFNSHGLFWYTNMATVLVFWNTKMAVVTSCENAHIMYATNQIEVK